jgi:hypothetical protein
LPSGITIHQFFDILYDYTPYPREKKQLRKNDYARSESAGKNAQEYALLYALYAYEIDDTMTQNCKNLSKINIKKSEGLHNKG